MCTVLEVVNCFLLELPEHPVINDIHKQTLSFETNMILNRLSTKQF